MTSALFEVPVKNDKRYNGNKIFILFFTFIPTDIDYGVPDRVTVTILDDEGK